MPQDPMVDGAEDDPRSSDWSHWNTRWTKRVFIMWRYGTGTVPVPMHLTEGFSKEVADVHRIMEEFRLVRDEPNTKEQMTDTIGLSGSKWRSTMEDSST